MIELLIPGIPLLLGALWAVLRRRTAFRRWEPQVKAAARFAYVSTDLLCRAGRLAPEGKEREYIRRVKNWHARYRCPLAWDVLAPLLREWADTWTEEKKGNDA